MTNAGVRRLDRETVASAEAALAEHPDVAARFLARLSELVRPRLTDPPTTFNNRQEA